MRVAGHSSLEGSWSIHIPFLNFFVSAAEKVESDTKTGRRPWSTDAPVNMALSTSIQRWTSGSGPYSMVCKALSVHSVKISSAGVECLLFHNGVTHASVWGELLLLLGGALTSRDWHSFREHPTNSSEHATNGSAQSKLLQLALGPQFPVQLSCCEKAENSKRHVRKRQNKRMDICSIN